MFEHSLKDIVEYKGVQYSLIDYFKEHKDIIAIRYDYEKYSYFLVNDTLRSDYNGHYDDIVCLVRCENLTDDEKFCASAKVFRNRNDWMLHNGSDSEAVKECKEITKATATPLELYIIFGKRPER